MHLSSITIKGFKSFPERTKLVFSPGVSVIVGPNGCGKSNVTDAVLWALGEQSPLSVRGQTMQDMIYAGGEGLGPSRYAEVEVVLDVDRERPVAGNLGTSDQEAGGAAGIGSEFSELAIARRLERGGEGTYRLNGARARLADVIEVLADANLGREMHSVISQGRVEEIVLSAPRERRLLVEEAAGLGKHRKRRRRAQLKLERTQDNLDRALDVEREARSRLRPLKRQAQAADIHARLEREAGELRGRLLASELHGHESELAGAEKVAGEAREATEAIDSELAEVNRARTAIEEQLAERDRERTQSWGRLTAVRAAHERISVRAEALAGRRAELSGSLDRRRRRARRARDRARRGDRCATGRRPRERRPRAHCRVARRGSAGAGNGPRGDRRPRPGGGDRRDPRGRRARRGDGAQARRPARQPAPGLARGAARARGRVAGGDRGALRGGGRRPRRRGRACGGARAQDAGRG